MKLVNLTPKQLQCGIGACPAIFETDHGTYVIIGRKIAVPLLTNAGAKPAPDEAAIEIPKDLLSTISELSRK